MTFAVPQINLMTRFCARAEEATDVKQKYSFGPMELVLLFLEMYPKVKPIFDACTTQPPDPGPVPAPLSAVGVTGESWEEANGLKFASENSKGNFSGGFSRKAIINTSREIAKSKHIKPKQARPLAIAALTTAQQESAEDLAVTIHQAKANKSQFKLD